MSVPERDRLILADAQVSADLRTFVSRARAADDGAIRLHAAGTVLAAYVCLLKPRTFGDDTPTILGLRTMALGSVSEIDVTVFLSAVADRLAHMGPDGVILQLPPTTVNESWTGIAAPRGGWTAAGTVSSFELEAAAREGIRAVAELVPANPGGHMVDAARAAVWGRPLQGMEPELPAGAAFAAFALGFLTDVPATVHQSGRWTRISTPRGHVLARSSAAL